MHCSHQCHLHTSPWTYWATLVQPTYILDKNTGGDLKSFIIPTFRAYSMGETNEKCYSKMTENALFHVTAVEENGASNPEVGHVTKILS